MAGTYFFHRITRQLKIVYAFESAAPYENNPGLWERWSSPAEGYEDPRSDSERIAEREAAIERLRSYVPRTPESKPQVAQRRKPEPEPLEVFQERQRSREQRRRDSRERQRSSPLPLGPRKTHKSKPEPEPPRIVILDRILECPRYPNIKQPSYCAAYESAFQRNISDIVEQRFTRWLREHYPMECEREEW